VAKDKVAKDDVNMGGMELQTFIRETLTSIINGVAEAQRGLDGKDHNAVINPLNNEHMGHAVAAPIEFDIAVTVAADTTNKGQASTGVKLKVPLVEFGVGAGLETVGVDRSGYTSRVRFKVPVALPDVLGPEGKPHPEREPMKGIV
jgi:hypothetical protein